MRSPPAGRSGRRRDLLRMRHRPAMPKLERQRSPPRSELAQKNTDLIGFHVFNIRTIQPYSLEPDVSSFKENKDVHGSESLQADASEWRGAGRLWLTAVAQRGLLQLDPDLQ